MDDAKKIILDNAIFKMLLKLGLSTAEALEPYYPRVRDREDIGVWRCRQTGALLLSRSDHQGEHYHVDKDKSLMEATVGDESYHDQLFRQSITDDQIRAKRYEPLILNRRWLDVGTGGGSMLRMLQRKAKVVHSVEPNRRDREHLLAEGIVCHVAVEELPLEPAYDVVTLFHVLEHIQEPIALLREIRQRMSVGGTIVVEVPHARDVLLDFFNLEAFKRATFWSEHLILHTRVTLMAILEHAGFGRVLIEGVQRYPLANHLRWLVEGKPNGHRDWSNFRADDLDTAYANLLARMDTTDTLVATAVNIGE